MRSKISVSDKIHWFLTNDQRTENYYRLQYEHLFAKHYDQKTDTIKCGDLTLPRLSHNLYPTREEAYYALEIGDILYPGLFDSYKFIDEGPYEWMDVEIEKGDVVFDCGANLGIFSLFAAHRGATVYAFEPILEARKIMNQVLVLNSNLKDKVTVVPYALSDKKGTAEFTLLKDTLVGSSMVLPHEGEKETANITTIDDFCNEYRISPDFIKSDIEGAERLMLSGAQKTLKESSPKLSICTYHFPDDKKVIKQLILQANQNYKIIDKWKKYYARV